jgi:hypothetical protein
MKKAINYFTKNWTTILLSLGALIIFGVVIPDQISQMKIKNSAMRSISNNGLIFKGDTIIVSNLSNVVFLPEDRDSLKILFNKADKLTERIYENRHRIGEFQKVIGTLHNGKLTVKYHYNMFNFDGKLIVKYHYNMFDFVSLSFEGNNNWFFGSIHMMYNDDADKFIYILTKYKKYQDEAIKEANKEIAKRNKILKELKSI